MIIPLGSGAAARAPRRALAAGALALGVLVLHALLVDRVMRPAMPATAGPEAAVGRAVSLAPVRVARAEISAERDVRMDALPTQGPVAPRMARRPEPRAIAPVERSATPVETSAPTAPERATAPTAPVAATAADPPSVVSPLGSPPRDDAPMPEDPPPVYATKPPPPARLVYALRRGGAGGQATLDWQSDDDGYRLRLRATLPTGAALDQLSQGGFDASGLAPLRLADRRGGRAAQAVNFQRSQQRITFSGPRWEYPLVPGVQDRLSWIVQLTAMAAASVPARDDEFVLQVVGARGATARWRFRVAGAERVDAGAGPVDTVRLAREPEHLYDLRIELWLDPMREYWPLRLRQTQVPGGEALEWTLVDGPLRPDGS